MFGAVARWRAPDAAHCQQGPLEGCREAAPVRTLRQIVGDLAPLQWLRALMDTGCSYVSAVVLIRAGQSMERCFERSLTRFFAPVVLQHCFAGCCTGCLGRCVGVSLVKNVHSCAAGTSANELA